MSNVKSNYVRYDSLHNKTLIKLEKKLLQHYFQYPTNELIINKVVNKRLMRSIYV